MTFCCIHAEVCRKSQRITPYKESNTEFRGHDYTDVKDIFYVK